MFLTVGPLEAFKTPDYTVRLQQRYVYKEHFPDLDGRRTFYSQSTSSVQWTIEHTLEMFL